jgi:hypothetical protein
LKAIPGPFGQSPGYVLRGQIQGREVLPVPAQDEPLLDLALAASGGGGGKGKKRGKKIGTLEELLEKHPEEFKEIFIDGTEQELPKPKDKAPRKEYYSGKRKRHTAKMQVVSTRRSKLVLHLCRHVPGRVSDLLLLRATGVMRKKMAEGVRVRVDKGYDEGLEEEYPEVRVQKPKKARRGHPLRVLEKIYNRADEHFEDTGGACDRASEEVSAIGGDLPGRAGALRGERVAVIGGLHNYKELGGLSW